MNPVFKRVERETFESWKWQDSYDAIFMTWSAGYIDDNELVKWLKEAKDHLNIKKKRNSGQESFIYLFDNITDEEEIFISNN